MGHIFQIRSLIFGAALATGLLITSVAQAHISLLESIPAANAVVATLEQIDLVFNERLVTRASRLELNILTNQETEEKFEHFDTEFINDGKTLRVNLHRPLETGIYRVQWRVVGNDNHPMIGELSFSVE